MGSGDLVRRKKCENLAGSRLYKVVHVYRQVLWLVRKPMN